MMETTSGESFFGIFELDRSGTILYSRPSERSEAAEDAFSIVGQNFFEKFRQAEYAESMRRHVRSFLSSQRSVDSFIFEGGFDEIPVRAKVLMTRGHETYDDSPLSIVIMDIKKT